MLDALHRRFLNGDVSPENFNDAVRILRDRAGLTAQQVEAARRAYAENARLWGERAQQQEAAQRKAIDLFRSVAGEEAFQTLERGAPVVVRGGSSGKVYHLHKRATYCVSVPESGAQLCAVVPGVPLYDHLLGIKLMIEHDEPRFLKTANKAPGLPSAAYVDQYRDRMLLELERREAIERRRSMFASSQVNDPTRW